MNRSQRKTRRKWMRMQKNHKKTAWNWIEGEILDPFGRGWRRGRKKEARKKKRSRRRNKFWRMIGSDTCDSSSFPSSSLHSHFFSISFIIPSFLPRHPSKKRKTAQVFSARNIGQPCSVNINCKDVIHQSKCHGRRRGTHSWIHP